MLEAVSRSGGRPRLVGGGVRDWLAGLEPDDFDLEVASVDFERLHRALAPFGATDVVGRSFGVIKVRSAASGAEWDANVRDEVRIVSAALPIPSPGYHTLKVWMVDPGITIQKLVVDVGGLKKPNYLGPPESFHRLPAR